MIVPIRELVWEILSVCIEHLSKAVTLSNTICFEMDRENGGSDIDEDMDCIFDSSDDEERFSNAPGHPLYRPIDSESSETEEEDAYTDSIGVDDDKDWINDGDKWVDNLEQLNLDFTAAPKVNIGQDESPFDYFKLFFNEEFIHNLVSSVNTHAATIEPTENSSWKDTDVAEMETFLGVIFFAGHFNVMRLDELWRHSPFSPAFGRFMDKNRFFMLLQYLCYTATDNGNLKNILPSDVDTQPIIDHFNNLMLNLMVPERNLTIDESLVLYRGRHAIDQCIKDKRNKYDVILYALIDSKGICQKIHMHHKVADPIVDDRDHVSKVVKSLMENYLEKGYSLYMDLYYNSIDLAEDLIARKTYCTGTLKAKRSRNPSHVVRARIPKGRCIYKFNKNGVCVANFGVTRTIKVSAISTQHSGQLDQSTNKRGKTFIEPKMLQEYMRNMKGVDHKNELTDFYPFYPKSMRWYKKVIIHMFHVMLLNSYLLLKIKNPNANMNDYRQNIIKRLVKFSEDSDDDNDDEEEDNKRQMA